VLLAEHTATTRTGPDQTKSADLSETRADPTDFGRGRGSRTKSGLARPVEFGLELPVPKRARSEDGATSRAWSGSAGPTISFQRSTAFSARSSTAASVPDARKLDCSLNTQPLTVCRCLRIQSMFVSVYLVLSFLLTVVCFSSSLWFFLLHCLC